MRIGGDLTECKSGIEEEKQSHRDDGEAKEVGNKDADETKKEGGGEGRIWLLAEEANEDDEEGNDQNKIAGKADKTGSGKKV